MCGEEGGGKQFGDATDTAVTRVHASAKLAQEYLASCFWCGLHFDSLQCSSNA